MSDHEHAEVFPVAEVRELIALMKASDLDEVLIKRGDAKIHLKRVGSAPPTTTVVPVYSAAQPVAVATPATPVAAATPESAVATTDATQADTIAGETVTAPMVGTYYASPSPKEPPYVQVGDEVRPGDVLGIIEAMKIMNEIECEAHGRVAQILVQNGQPVEYGQPLMIIEPL